jgi:hypothetical protein
LLVSNDASTPVELLTVSELIKVLEGLRAWYGANSPVAISDADTGMQMPIIAIERTADGHLLLMGTGYGDPSDGVKAPNEPTESVWVQNGYRRDSDGFAVYWSVNE